VEDLRNWLESITALDSSNDPGRKHGPRNGVISEINGQRRGPVLLFAEIPGFRKVLELSPVPSSTQRVWVKTNDAV
jgi:hypothetical protein